MQRYWQRLVLFSICLLVVGGCTKEKMQVPVSSERALSITVPLINTSNKKIGEVELLDEEKGLTLFIEAEGLTPGLHAIHFHETGKCTPPDFSSAGGHFNPTKKEHGFDNPKGYHAGDLPNLEVDAAGSVSAKITTAAVTLQKGVANSLRDNDGSSIIIHAKPDDYRTDPSGNSGDRIACAAITDGE